MVEPGDSSGEVEEATYRVRLWNEPTNSAASWMLDEWQFEDAHDVSEVIGWAESRHATTYGVIVLSESHHLDADGQAQVDRGYVRVAGKPGDVSPTTQKVTFTAI
jgi:hypothetical protein